MFLLLFFCCFYTPPHPRKQSFGGYIGIILSCQFVGPFFLMDELILMKLYTVAVYDLRMYMKEDYPSPKYFN